ncbi:iron-siderophore ABC transporter substrate-binding protein [Bacillaceae bacterium]
MANSAAGATTDASKQDKQTAGKETRVIKHAMGETEVPAHPQRVVVLTNEGTEALLALGIKPVGAVQSWTGDPWYDHIKEQMEGVTPVGLESQVNLEAVAALKPDLIIGNKMRQEKIYPQLSAIAPTVFSETLRGEWQTNFKLYAEAVNKAAEGEKILADFDKRIAEFKAKAGDKLAMKVSIVRFMPGSTRLYQKDSFSGVILDQIGFARPESQNVDAFAEEITKERIPDMDGDILFYFTYEKGDGEASKQEEEWINDPLFKNLNVVKAGKVYKVDDVIWNTAGGVIAANLFLDDLEKYFLQN